MLNTRYKICSYIIANTLGVLNTSWKALPSLKKPQQLDHSEQNDLMVSDIVFVSFSATKTGPSLRDVSENNFTDNPTRRNRTIPE